MFCHAKLYSVSAIHKKISKFKYLCNYNLRISAFILHLPLHFLYFS